VAESLAVPQQLFLARTLLRQPVRRPHKHRIRRLRLHGGPHPATSIFLRLHFVSILQSSKHSVQTLRGRRLLSIFNGSYTVVHFAAPVKKRKSARFPSPRSRFPAEDQRLSPKLEICVGPTDRSEKNLDLKIGFCRGLRIGIDEQSIETDVPREASPLMPDTFSVEPLEIHHGVDAETNLFSSLQTVPKIQRRFLRASTISFQDDLLNTTKQLLLLPTPTRLRIDQLCEPSLSGGTLTTRQYCKIGTRYAFQLIPAHLLVLFFLIPAEIVCVLVTPYDLATRDRKTTAIPSPFCPFQSKGFAHVLNVHFALCIGKGRQRKVQFNRRTDRWKDGSIHKCSLLADVSSVPLAMSHSSLLILPRERCRDLQWVANRSPALYRRPPPRASRTVNQLPCFCRAVQSP
jgi:hypothetical protein